MERVAKNKGQARAAKDRRSLVKPQTQPPQHPRPKLNIPKETPTTYRAIPRRDYNTSQILHVKDVVIF